MKENIMSEEAFNELVNSFEYVATLTEYGRKNIKYHIQRLQQENKKQSDKIKEVLTLLENFNADQVCTHTTHLSNEIEKILRGVSE